MSREEWLALRKERIGGSDAAAIVGLSPWASAYSVWAEKTGKVPPKEETEAMRQGTDLEEYVARRFAEKTGKKVRRDNHLIVNPKYAFAHANVDRVIAGEDAGLECKTTSTLNLRRFGDNEYPDNYYVQCMHYMMVTGAQRWYLAVLVLGKDFLVYEIERDEEEIRALADAERRFWDNCLVKGREPEIDGHAATGDAINAIWQQSSADNRIDLTGISSVLLAYSRTKAAIKEMQDVLDRQTNEIKAYMGDAERGEDSNFRVIWKTQERRGLDAKKLKAAYPDIDYGKYEKVTTSRPFTIKEIGGKDNG